nr:MAG TPA: hypothetical protein [Caudoviricetes sp.]
MPPVDCDAEGGIRCGKERNYTRITGRKRPRSSRTAFRKSCSTV